MLRETLYSDGTDQFPDRTYSPQEWSAPMMASPEEIRRRLDGLQLCGRRIAEMRPLGFSWYQDRDWIEETAYAHWQDCPEEERQLRSRYENIDPQLEFQRVIRIDEPFLIRFEDEDIFEITVPQEAEFRFSMNCIPWSLEPHGGAQNVDADVLFSPCVGQTVTGVEVNTYLTDEDPLLGRFEEPPYRRELVSDITLRLENGAALRVCGWADYCIVACVDGAGEILTLPFSELKKGLYNWEDIHDDEALGLKGKSPTLFFGRKGRAWNEVPYFLLAPNDSGRRGNFVTICWEDFLLLGWCIAHQQGAWFDENAFYHFSGQGWFSILDEGERLLSVGRFDELFDELVGWNICYRNGENSLLLALNNRGAEFWRDRDKYRAQLKTLRAWSERVLRDGDIMSVYGY